MYFPYNNNNSRITRTPTTTTEIPSDFHFTSSAHCRKQVKTAKPPRHHHQIKTKSVKRKQTNHCDSSQIYTRMPVFVPALATLYACKYKCMFTHTRTDELLITTITTKQGMLASSTRISPCKTNISSQTKTEISETPFVRSFALSRFYSLITL